MNINDLGYTMTDAMMRCEDECLRQVLEQLIGRYPVPEDGKLLTIIYHNDYPARYLLMFKNTVLGLVTKSIDIEKNQFNCNFNPKIKSFNQINQNNEAEN